ncbi:membrane protein [Mycobacterium phage LilSpotty]|uniref:Membrane protein n=1 Tax=Mycobacterium phage LilSpotty TaxID=2588512 RepID=A0A4Y6EM36_9CAUD|nr:membrane protein [Mycobacterium phage LilSpotty]QDF19766.1 membrane protein [Mycobacterium phage LilSpotty]
MNWLTDPSVWTSLSGPGVAMIAAGLFVWALATGRLVLGSQYRAERARADKYDDANRQLTQALIEGNARQETTTHILAALRDAVASGEVKT